MTGPSDWFASAGGASPWAARVFCFAHAGGNARSFLSWQPRLGGEAEIIGVCPPGKGARAREAVPSFDELVEGAALAIAEAAERDNRSVFLFGHSLGALEAFEAARRLSDLSTLRHLVASGLNAPSLLPSERVLELSKLDGKAFVEALGFFGGIPPEVIADEDLQEFLLPGLIGDFRMAAGYKYRSAPPLGIDISLINGRDDPHVGPEGLVAWRNECRNEPAYHWAEGGHFYFQDQPSVVPDVLLEVIRADQHVELL
jgi:surfactin synthase thioesterase subunit